MKHWMAMEIMMEAHDVGLRKLDDLSKALEALKEGKKDEAVGTFKEAAGFFEDELRMHFRHEEQALFPALARVIGRAGPVQAMVEEHDSIWRAVESFEELVEELASADDSALSRLVPQAEREVAHIRWILSSHIQKENSMLFPLAEKTLDAAGKQEVDESVRTVEVVYGPH